MPSFRRRRSASNVLSVPNGATVDQIRKAYKQSALKWHPDRHQDPVQKQKAEQEFIEVHDAYRRLMRRIERSERRKNAVNPPDPSKLVASHNTNLSVTEVSSLATPVSRQAQLMPPTSPIISIHRSFSGSHNSSLRPSCSTPLSSPKYHHVPPSPRLDPPTSSPANFDPRPPSPPLSEIPKAAQPSKWRDRLRFRPFRLPRRRKSTVRLRGLASHQSSFADLKHPGRSRPDLVHPGEHARMGTSLSSLWPDSHSSIPEPDSGPSTISTTSSGPGSKESNARLASKGRSKRSGKRKSGPKRKASRVLSDPVDSPAARITLVPDQSSNAEWTYRIDLTLEELFLGIYYTFHITRHIRVRSSAPPASSSPPPPTSPLTPAAPLSPQPTLVAQTLAIDVRVPRGARTGTKIRCADAGHERADGTFEDVVFVVAELPHARFRRRRHDLHLVLPDVLWEPAMAHESIALRFAGLDGQMMAARIPRVPRHAGPSLSGQTCISGGGMPVYKEGRLEGRGDLFVRWEIVWPDPKGKPQFWSRLWQIARP